MIFRIYLGQEGDWTFRFSRESAGLSSTFNRLPVANVESPLKYAGYLVGTRLYVLIFKCKVLAPVNEKTKRLSELEYRIGIANLVRV